MARLGYLVVGIQHEQPGDPALPFSGNMMVLRMPFWRTGVANLLFGARRCNVTTPNTTGTTSPSSVIRTAGMSLPPGPGAAWVGHRAVTLDNRRYPLPRTANPRVLSIRAGKDIPADPGVLPDAATQARSACRS
jgi:hypothetical protein